MYNKSDYHLENCKKAGIIGNEKIQKLKQERIDEYDKNPKLCKYCNKPFDYFHRKKIFCNSSCSASFNNQNRTLSNITKEKISGKLKGKNKDTNLLSKEYFTNICPICHEEYKTRKKKQIYCSRKCSGKINGCCESAKKKISIKVQERIKNGTFSGWTSRKGRPSSYPELYFIDLFNNENIIGWEKDLMIGKWFIDFAFTNKKIALEIDGKQHGYKDRKEKDVEKDSYLTETGWEVIRIKWYNPINDINKEKLYTQVDNFKSRIKDDYRV